LPRDGRSGSESSLNVYRYGIAALAILFVGMGIALVVVTAARGSAAFGYLMGALFVALGLGRLYLLRNQR
jgi:hypothetical protein